MAYLKDTLQDTFISSYRIRSFNGTEARGEGRGRKQADQADTKRESTAGQEGKGERFVPERNGFYPAGHLREQGVEHRDHEQTFRDC